MLKLIIRSMRLKQWTKNVFILAALVFDRQLNNLDALINTLIGMLLFCLLSSSVYLINDMVDIQADLKHPSKKHRPIASGKLPMPIALITALALSLSSLVLSYWLSPTFAIIGGVYFILNLAYSKWLKNIPIIDVLVIACGFVLRVAAGVFIIGVERFSPWLYVVTTLLALYLGFGKRRAELTLLAQEANQHRRVLDGYSIPFLDQLITIVSSTTIIAYSLYTFTAPSLPENHVMMLTIPFVLYGIFRYLFIISVKKSGGAPEEIVLTDWPLQLSIFFWGICVIVIFYSNQISSIFQ
ncbi:MAG TPA: decaprenyl-phosphate phosphoribosyltransferase [Anaerolineae bacterium]|nr:decaprenyl-phosphate phosphoribosyltransferase [Anaerolineae bacterium]